MSSAPIDYLKRVPVPGKPGAYLLVDEHEKVFDVGKLILKTHAEGKVSKK